MGKLDKIVRKRKKLKISDIHYDTANAGVIFCPTGSPQHGVRYGVYFLRGSCVTALTKEETVDLVCKAGVSCTDLAQRTESSPGGSVKALCGNFDCWILPIRRTLFRRNASCFLRSDVYLSCCRIRFCMDIGLMNCCASTLRISI